MELKQLAGNRNLYDVMRQQKRRQKVVDAKAAKAYKTDRAQAQSSGYVFDIINRKLSSRKTGVAFCFTHYDHRIGILRARVFSC